MRESLFIKKNLPRWKRYQEEHTEDPDEMAERFVSLLDDLSYAKTFYSFSKVTRYINGMAAAMYQRIYRQRKDQTGRLHRFFAQELPLIIRRHHRIFLFTTCYFLLFCILGAFSSAHDETFVRGVLGDGYVNMTNENIAKGDPFGVYKQEGPWLMFIMIAYNNLRVMFFCFVAGIAFSLGSLYTLFKNGVMLGTFQYIFFAHGLGLESVLVIWIHGTLEISAIIISGTAGMIMGNSLLFPGTRKRMDALKSAAKDGLKIIVALIPVILTAAFLEGFVTRHTDMPIALSSSILLLSLLIIIGYFGIYPFYVQRKGYRLDENSQVIRPERTTTVS